MYIFQALVVLNADSAFVDEFQFIYLLPIMAIVIPTVYLVRARMLNKLNEASKSMQELEDEFKLSPRNFWGKLKQYF
ncbi:hypothetical protein MHTCC0001_04400 [Flavobacteriaceae bacterium MHTCC 0001]